MDIISSAENPHIKTLKSLNEKKYRKFYGEFVLEGPKSVKEAVSAGTVITKLFVAASKQGEYADLIAKNKSTTIIVADKLFGRLTDTVSPQGIIAQAQMKAGKEFNPTAKPFLVLDRISDPGNLGTIIRTAVATGFNDIVLIDCADPYAPKTVRSSASGINYVNFYPIDEKTLTEKCDNVGIQIFLADMAGRNIFNADLPSENYCLVIGNEANGPSDCLKKKADLILSLPMRAEMESLNAGVCASIMMYAMVGKDL